MISRISFSSRFDKKQILNGWNSARKAILLLLILLLLLGNYQAIYAQQNTGQKEQNNETSNSSPEENQSSQNEEETDQEQEEETLPLLSEMEVPSAEHLLKEPPLDWIVLKNSNEVIVAEPVSPRPHTLEKMEAEIEKARKGPRDDLEAYLEKIEQLHYIKVVLPEDLEQGEYQLHKKFIEKIIHHEDLMLQRVDLLLDEGKIRQAFEILLVLNRQHPNWPGYDPRYNRLLFLESESQLQQNRPEQALVTLEQLHARNADYPRLSEQLGRVVDRLITQAVNQEDYRRARYFRHRLLQSESSHPLGRDWKNQLSQKATELMQKALKARNESRHDQAALLIEQAAKIWPEAPSLQNIHRTLTHRFQRLKVGVWHFVPRKHNLPFSTPARRRRKYLTQASLFEIDRTDNAPHYRSRFFDQWEPTDLGRQVDFTLRRERTPWEAHPIVTASDVVQSILNRLNPDHPQYDERLDGYINSVNAFSPFKYTVHFERVPLRTEALFTFPVTTRGNDLTTTQNESPQKPASSDPILSSRFKVLEQSAEKTVFRRNIPEADDLSDYHIAEVIEKNYPSYEKALQGLLRGEVDLLPTVRHSDIQSLREDGRFFLQKYALPTTHVLQFNPESPALKNRELRRALLYALDRHRILQQEFLHSTGEKRGRIITAPFPTQSYAYNALMTPRQYELQLAIALTIAARKQLGDKLKKLKLLCVSDAPSQKAATQIVRQWERLGINIQLTTASDLPDETNTESKNKTWDILYRKVRMAEPFHEIWPFLALKPTARVQDLNHFPTWLRQELVELDNSSDWNSAINRMKQLHKHLWSEVQLIPLWEIDEYMAILKTVNGNRSQPVRFYQDIENWSIAPSYPKSFQ